MSYIPVSSPQGFTPDQQKKIIEVLNQKITVCPACRRLKTYQLVTDGIIYMPVAQPATYQIPYVTPQYQVQGRGLPCIALICQNCGNLQFHSVIQLGLGEILGTVVPSPYGGQ